MGEILKEMLLRSEEKPKMTWDARATSSDEINKKIRELEEQILAWELEVKYEDKLAAFREIYLEWYNGRLSLMQLLQAMMDRSICKRICVFDRD